MPKRRRVEINQVKELHVEKTEVETEEAKENDKTGLRPTKRRIVKEVSKEVVEEVKVRKKKIIIEGISEQQAYLRNTEGARVLKVAEGSKKMLGAHVSAAGGLEQAIYNAIALGCRSFALFIRNQRRWDSPPLKDETITLWENAIKEHGFPVNQIIPHGSYLMNSGSPVPETLEKTRTALLEECQRCERLGIPAYNFHPGSTTGKCTMEESIQKIADTINYVHENTKFITLVVETMSGQGSTVGGKFEDLRQIINLVKDKNRIGICIDTCHIFAAGYDIRTKETYDETMKEFDQIVGFQYLKAVHLNDSKGDLGCNLDRHENIGKGKLKTAFQWLMKDPRFDNIPMVLETPWSEDNKCPYANEMELLYKMEKTKPEE